MTSLRPPCQQGCHDQLLQLCAAFGAAPSDPCIRAAQVQLALKARGLRDDITVIVVDALPEPGARLPPLLQQRKSAGASNADATDAAVVIGRPLEQAGGAWRQAVWCALRT